MGPLNTISGVQSLRYEYYIYITKDLVRRLFVRLYFYCSIFSRHLIVTHFYISERLFFVCLMNNRTFYRFDFTQLMFDRCTQTLNSVVMEIIL